MKDQSKCLSLGFIGGGLSSAIGMTHYSACELDGIWKVVAGAFSRNPEVNDRTAEKWNIEKDRVYGNWRDLVDREKGKLDAVCILTDTPGHAEIIDCLLDRKIPIICEKSIVMNTGQGMELQKKYEKGKNFFASIFNYTGYPIIRELRERILRGELGDLIQVHVEMPQEGLIRPPAISGKASPPQKWRLSDEKIPTLCLDLGVHMHNLVSFLTDQSPSEVFAEFGNHSPYKNLVDYAQLLLRFERGMKGSFWMTKTAIGCRNGLTVKVFGKQASASWCQMVPEELQISHLNGRREVVDRGGQTHLAGESRYNRMKAGHPAGFIEAFGNLYADIAMALKEFYDRGSYKNPYVYGLNDAVNGIKFFEAAMESNLQQRWISIDKFLPNV